MKRRNGNWGTLNDISEGLRFMYGLPPFFRRPLGVREAKDILKQRFAVRESTFLEFIRRAVYENPQSPYLKLFRRAGCELGDLEHLVEEGGIEGTLRILFESGVYLTVKEFKGRQPIERQGICLQANPGLLRNPLASPRILAHTSGSGGVSTPVPIDMSFIRQRIVNHFLALWSRGGLGWKHSVWGVPGHTDIIRMLEFSSSGATSIRWFSQVDPAQPDLHARYRWSVRFLRWVGIFHGVSIAFPEYVPLNDPLRIGCWLRQELESGNTPHLVTFATPAVRVCQAVSEAGIDISGAEFSIGGEPITQGRLELIRKSGVAALPRYGAIETGNFGYGCLKPDAPDDLHLYHDLHGIIQPNNKGSDCGLPPNALLISSLLPTAPFVLINVSLGDQAVIVKRPCGCALENLGYTSHLKFIRSFEKLTCGGMTFLDAEIIPVLEEVLPARFGGTAIDYQLVERETDTGQQQLLLYVNPSIGPFDERKMKEAFLNAIGAGTGAKRIMSLQWRHADVLSIKKQSPEVTKTGKILHVFRSSP